MLNKHGRMAMPDVKKNGRCRIQQKQKFKQSTLLCQGKMNVDRILNFCYRKKNTTLSGSEPEVCFVYISMCFRDFSVRKMQDVSNYTKANKNICKKFCLFVCLFVCMYVCLYVLFVC